MSITQTDLRKQMIKSHPHNINKLFCSWRDFDGYVSKIANQLQSSQWIPDYIVGVKRGGLIPAIKLSHMIDKPLIMMSCQLRDDTDNRVKLLEAEALSRDRKILIVDDICDSGNTLQKIIEEIQNCGFLNVKIGALYYNTSQPFKIDYFAKVIDRSYDKRWIIFPWEYNL